MKRLIVALSVSAMVAAVLTMLVGAGVLQGTWVAFVGAAVSAGLGLWLSQSLSKSTVVREAFRKARSFTPSAELADELEEAGQRSRRTLLGKKTDEHTTRGPLGQMLSAGLVLLRHAYATHRREFITIVLLLAGYITVQFVNVPIVEAMRGAVTIVLFTAAAFTLVSLFTDDE